MIPYNVVSTFPYHWRQKGKVVKTRYILPVSQTGSETPIGFQTALKRSLLNVITTPQLRAAFLFLYENDQTQMISYESDQSPINQKEARGVFALAMRNFQKQPNPILMKVKPRAKGVLPSYKPIVQKLEQMHDGQKFFLILLYKSFLFMTGSYYDESSICHALIQFQETKGCNLSKPLYQHESLENRVKRLRQKEPLKVL